MVMRFGLAILLFLLLAAGVALALMSISRNLMDEIPTSWALMLSYCVAVFVLYVIAGWIIGLLRRSVSNRTKTVYLVLAAVFAIASPFVGVASVAVYYCSQGSCR